MNNKSIYDQTKTLDTNENEILSFKQNNASRQIALVYILIRRIRHKAASAL